MEWAYFPREFILLNEQRTVEQSREGRCGQKGMSVGAEEGSKKRTSSADTTLSHLNRCINIPFQARRGGARL